MSGKVDVRGSEAVTKRLPRIRTTFMRAADPHLQALQDIDELASDVRARLTSHPPPYLNLDDELDGDELANDKVPTKPKGSV